MLLVAIASKAFLGKIERMNSQKSSFLTSPTLDAASAASMIGAPTPGCSQLTISRPSPIEMKLAMMNHRIARNPIRPSAALSPMWAMPTTMVDRISGATSSLIRLRKMSDSSLKVLVIATKTGSPAGTETWTA